MLKSSLASEGGVLWEIAKRLAEEVINHGGTDADTRHINANPNLIKKMAKLVVGPVWDLVGKPITLDVDYDTSIGEFCDKAKSSGVILGAELFTHDNPGIPLFFDSPHCRPYKELKLVHFEGDVDADHVRSMYLTAGIRELYTYMQTVKIPHGTLIVAIGSPLHGRFDEVKGKYPEAYIGSSTREIHTTNGKTIDPRRFLLVRA